jgi:hypothetical protein
MNLNQIARLGFGLSLALVVATGFGCRSASPRAWNVNFNKNTLTTVEVDTIGVSPSLKPELQNMSVDEYWAPGSPLRKNLMDRIVTCDFQTGTNWVIKVDDPMWQKWLGYGSTELMVIGRLSISEASTGTYDRRRIFLSLAPRDWKAKHKTVEIEVRDQFILVVTPPRIHT